MTDDVLAGRRVGFIGSGNMAEAIIRGLLASKTVDPSQITASDVLKERLDFI
jgi:pyrroline-5-carboxylate reductase